MKSLNTLEEILAASSEAMKSTKRVGDPTEDASMSKARPRLAAMNAFGLLTIDSQMGKKNGKCMQRAYLEAIVDGDLAIELHDALCQDDSICRAACQK
jgi:hypothetical protein